VAALVGRRLTATRSELFDELLALAAAQAGALAPVRQVAARDRTSVPYLNEPWYC